MRAAVLPAMEAKYASSARVVSKAAFSSRTWPSHSRPMVAAMRAATSLPSWAAISEARARRKSPATMATRFPQRALTVSTPRLVAASSMTSSW